jgi:hypothetical protein
MRFFVTLQISFAFIGKLRSTIAMPSSYLGATAWQSSYKQPLSFLLQRPSPAGRKGAIALQAGLITADEDPSAHLYEHRHGQDSARARVQGPRERLVTDMNSLVYVPLSGVVTYGKGSND